MTTELAYNAARGNQALIATRNVPIPARMARRIIPTLFAGQRKAKKRFWEFFTAHIRNPNTRMAYLTALYWFADWCEAPGIALERIEPMMVAAYIEQLTKQRAHNRVSEELSLDEIERIHI